MQIEHNRIKTLTPTSDRQPVGYLQAWPRIRTRDDREQIQRVARAGLETRDHRIASPTLWPFGYAASHLVFNKSLSNLVNLLI